MAKVLTADPSQVSPADRLRLQTWLFVKFNQRMGWNASDPSELGAAHLVEYLEKHVKNKVHEFETQSTMDTFQSGYTEVPME